MKCIKCKREIESNTEFCPYCGAKQKRNGKGRIKKIIITILALAVGGTCGRIMGYFSASAFNNASEEQSAKTEDFLEETDSLEESSTDLNEEKTENSDVNDTQEESEYSKFFSERGVMEPFYGLEIASLGQYTESFVKESETNSFSTLDFTYNEDDVITEQVEGLYIQVNSDEEKDAWISEMKKMYDSYNDLEFCTVTYNDSASMAYIKGEPFYISVEFKFTDLDNIVNVNTLKELLEMDGNGLISMKLTEENLLSQGWIKKP